MNKSEGLGVTIYALFGEQDAVEDPEFIHIEDIKSRSQLYDWRISAHAHRRMFQIVYLVTGSVEMQIEGSTSRVAAPCAIAIPPGAVHSFSFQEDTRGYVLSTADTLLLDGRFIRSRPLIEPLLSRAKAIDFSDAPETATFLRHLLAGMMHEFGQTLPGRSSMLDWLLRSVLLVLSRQMAMTEKPGGRRGYARATFSSFLKLVEDHYREHLGISDYARKLAMSPARLNRLCNTFASKSAQEIIHARITLEAQRLLLYTSATSSQVAFELGFQDPAYFTRFFRKRTGQTPSAFREHG